MILEFAASVLALSLLQGALVALPRQDALQRLTSFRSPMWALVLPGLIVVGTFGLVLVPSGADDLIDAAAIATPPLAALAALGVVRRHLAVVAFPVIAASGVGAVLLHGVLGEITASLVTACGAMLLGVVIVRLLPGKWLLVAVGVMCLVDVILMNFGVGRTSSALLDAATHSFRGPDFDAADIGRITTEYPDLLLAAVIGAAVAGRPHQRRTALLVVICVGLYDFSMLVVPQVPATPPLCIALLVSEWLRRRSARQAQVPEATAVPVAPPLPALDLAGLAAVPGVTAVPPACTSAPALGVETAPTALDHRRRVLRERGDAHGRLRVPRARRGRLTPEPSG